MHFVAVVTLMLQIQHFKPYWDQTVRISCCFPNSPSWSKFHTGIRSQNPKLHPSLQTSAERPTPNRALPHRPGVAKMWSALSLTIILSTLHFTFSENQISAIPEPYDLLFDNALEAYYKQDWLAVILNMEKALRNKGTVRKVQTQCRLSCADRDAFGDHFPGLGVPIPGAGPVEDLAFFQRILKRAECVNACESEKLGPPTLHKVSETVELEFKKRTPYNYLQVAYFKVNECFEMTKVCNNR